MANPRFVRTSSDDWMWFYEHDSTNRTDPDPFEDPDAFFSEVVFKVAPCSKPRTKCQFLRAKKQRGPGKTQFAGVCGTDMIIVSGAGLHIFEAYFRQSARPSYDRTIDLLEWKHFLATSVEAKRTLRSMRGDNLAVRAIASYWEGAEADLEGQPFRDGGIDFFVFPDDEKQVYVHLDLGSDPEFHNRWRGNLTESEKHNFRTWLLTETGIIERKLYRIDGAGKRIEVVGFQIDKIDMRMNEEFTKPDIASVPACPAGCKRVACSILAGSLTDFDAKNSVLVFDLEVVGMKTYCVDEDDGGPCTN